ncbi:hypothetical protein [Maricaulis sp.]|uniref:hypothetical protein n=1 Tax=Maricaulis sp. TaxID=1486257 RepID=UPI003A959730
MILSRIIHQLETQNWTAVALEFLLVLSSVVLGFQFTAWNEARQDRQEARLLIARISTELDQSLQLIENEIPASRNAVRATRAAHDMLVAGQVNETTREEFELNFLRASGLSEVRLHKSALEVFESSNAANSGTTPSLRLAIARYYGFVLIEREQEALLLEDFTALFRDLFSRFDADGDYFTTAHLRGDITALNHDPALARTLLQINFRQQFQLDRLEYIRATIIDLREQIRAEQATADGRLAPGTTPAQDGEPNAKQGQATLN